MVFRSPLAEFSRGLLFTDKEESCVCTFLATFSSWAIQKAWDAGKGICVKSLYDLLRPLSESTDCWSRLDGSGSETSQSWEVKSPASVSQRRGWEDTLPHLLGLQLWASLWLSYFHLRVKSGQEQWSSHRALPSTSGSPWEMLLDLRGCLEMCWHPAYWKSAPRDLRSIIPEYVM